MLKICVVWEQKQRMEMIFVRKLRSGHIRSTLAKIQFSMFYFPCHMYKAVILRVILYRDKCLSFTLREDSTLRVSERERERERNRKLDRTK
jgi:hypothetical protein